MKIFAMLILHWKQG